MYIALVKNNPTVQAMLAVLLAALLFSCMFAFPKSAEVSLPWYQIVFIRYCGGLLFLLPAAITWKSRGNSLKSKYAFVHFGRMLAGIGSVACVVIAATQIALVDVITISFSKGAIVLLLAGVLLGEKVFPRHWFAVATSIAGAVLVAYGSRNGDSQNLLHPASLIALLGTFCMAAEIIIIKFVSRREAIPITLLYVNGMATALLAVPSLLWGHWGDLADWWPILLMGPIAIVGQSLNLFAYRKVDVILLTPLSYSSIAFSAVIGILAFGEPLRWTTVIGATVIITGSLIGLEWRKRQLAAS
ncbi:DMT family transporter [Kiloniella laminariae]|uniref:DMT family transporter n=1 Tax=Kiloniella laminariae TaxID=454162 RepID=UPI00037D1BEB|nr:DMT family transporter [Kiloniella laminariae]